MGITADMESTAQERLSRKFRGDVRRIAGIDFAKTWTNLEHEGETEDMIMSISTPLPLILFPPILMAGRSHESQLVQALPEGDIQRSFNKGMTKRRRVASAPGERETSRDVIM